MASKDTSHDQYNSRVNDTLYKIANFVPAVFLGYGLLVQFKIVAGSPLYSWQALVLILLALVVAAIFQKDDFEQPPWQQFIYYVLFLLFAIFIAGMESILYFWPPLSVATVLNYGFRVYVLSTMLLVVAAVVESILQVYFLHNYTLIDNLVLAGTITVASVMVVAVVLALMTDHAHLIQTRRRESLQFGRMQALLNTLSDAIVTIDKKGKIRLYNAATLSLLDTNKSLAGIAIDDVVKTYDQKGKRIKIFDLVASENKIISTEELSHHFSDGEQIRLSLVSAPIHATYGKSGRSNEGHTFILRDITKTKSLEEERDEFISVISHELRTPIAITEASVSNMQLIAQRSAASEDIIKGLGETHDQVLYLARMINDLSALSRAERGVGLNKEKIDVNTLMRSLFKEYAPQAAAAGLVLNLDVVGSVGAVTTSRLYLEEILQNFITNAIKYTQKGSVTLHASRAEDGVLFSVRDTGPGISKSDREKVFDKFYRSEDYRTRETGGTGLGLYVAQKLADMIGTRIILTSRLHHGSDFCIFIKDTEDD